MAGLPSFPGALCPRADPKSSGPSRPQDRLGPLLFCARKNRTRTLQIRVRPDALSQRASSKCMLMRAGRWKTWLVQHLCPSSASPGLGPLFDTRRGGLG